MMNSLNQETRQLLEDTFQDKSTLNKIISQTEKSPLLTDMLNTYSARNGKIETIPGSVSKCSPDGNTIWISEHALALARREEKAESLTSALSEELSHAVLPNGTNVTAGPNYNEFIDRASESEAVGWNGRYIVLSQCGITDPLFSGEGHILSKKYEDAGIDIQKIGYDINTGFYHVQDGVSVPLDTSQAGAVDYLKKVVPERYSQKWDAEYLIANSGYDPASVDQEYIREHKVSRVKNPDGTENLGLKDIPYTFDGDMDKLDLNCTIKSDGYIKMCRGKLTFPDGSAIDRALSPGYDVSGKVEKIRVETRGYNSAGDLIVYEQQNIPNPPEKLDDAFDLRSIAREIDYHDEGYGYSTGSPL